MTFDQILLAFIILGAVIGLFHGFFREVVGTIGILIAVIAANYIAPLAGENLSALFSNERVASVVVWLTAFLFTMVVLVLLARLLDRIFSTLAMGWLNRLGGAVFGAVKHLLIAALLIALLEVVCSHVSGLKIASYLQESKVIPYIHQLVDVISPWAAEHILAPALKMLN